MQVRLHLDDPIALDTPLLAVAVFREDDLRSGSLARADALVGGAMARVREEGDFQGRDEDATLFYLPAHGNSRPRRLLFLGAGARAEAEPETLRVLAARAVRKAESLSLTDLTLVLPEGVGGAKEVAVQACAEGAILAAWDFREHKTSPGDDDAEPPPIVGGITLCVDGESDAAEDGLRIGTAWAEGEALARTLQWRPGNVATPTHLADIAIQLAGDYGFESRILGPAELEAEGMRAILAVSAGSEEEPRLIVLEHHGGEEGAPPIALVGKGLTFDTGGISIKPAQGMEDMKYDMSGGAAVLGAMKAIGMLELPINVVAVVPSSENLISGRATKPGDIIETRAGRTVEVINTDAEGRLILADALSYATDRYRPEAMVDCATLTGACVIALGHHAAAVLGNDEPLIQELRDAGDRAGERCWPLPLWKEYRKQLESPVADLKNVGGRPAGTITAAHFLSEFVGDVPWAHLDIAGTAYGDPRAPYHRKGGFGFPTRLLLEWVRARAR